MALLEHSAKADATAAESSALPPDDVYFDGMTQTLLRSGARGDREEETKVELRQRKARKIFRHNILSNLKATSMVVILYKACFLAEIPSQGRLDSIVEYML